MFEIAKYKIATSTLDMMKREEGFRAFPYRDGSTALGPAYSIGYGHQIQPGENLPGPITEAQATEILRKDLEIRLPNLNKVLPGNLTQKQFDQLLSYSMSFGLVRILESNLYKLIRENAPIDQIKAFWLNSYVTSNGVPNNGLKARRERQVSAFFFGPLPAS